MSDPIVSEAPVAQPDAPVDPSCDGGGSAEIVSRTVREREVKPADSGGEPPGEARGRPAAEGAVLASECSCRENGQFVYVVGDLGIDFGTQARLDSIQQGADTFNSGAKLDVRIVGYLLRHLLGWREIDADGGASYHRPHLYDADAVIWVLRMDESPVYAVRPGGPYAEDAYLELIRFLMEQEGYDERTEAVRENDRVERIIYPSLDTQNGSEPNRSRDKLGRPTRIIERVAIPGRLKGSVELYDGSVVPVISPDMRGTRSWSMPALVEMHAAVDPMLAEHQDQAKVMRNLDRITERFFEDVRNRGLAPEERAVNFVATQVFRFVPFLRDQFGEGFEPELDSISVSRSLICRQDSDCYDVEVAFFDPENVLRSKMVKARTVDVSDVVPVLLGDEREYRRR